MGDEATKFSICKLLEAASLSFLHFLIHAYIMHEIAIAIMTIATRIAIIIDELEVVTGVRVVVVIL